MSVHFVFLTDSHYYPGAPKDYGAPKMLTQSKTVLDAIVPAVNPIKPEFIVHGGDFLCGGSSFDLPWTTYLQSIEDVATAFAGFEAPMYCVPGNHDSDAQQGLLKRLRKDSTSLKHSRSLTLLHAFASRSLTSITNATQSKTATAFGPIPSTTPSVKEAEKAYDEGHAMLLFLHTWVLPSDEEGKGILNGADRLLETVKESPAIVALFTGHRHTQPYPDVS